MENQLAISSQKQSALAVMANRVNVEPEKLLATLKATVFQKATTEELLALVVVANEYKLNPFLKEIYAFPSQKGGIVPMVPIDGWTRIVNREADYDGVEFQWDERDDGKPLSCTCVMYAKSRSHPIKVTEHYDECYRNTNPWNQMPRRMLRHKAFMQAARLAYGLSGIFDEDEAKDALNNAKMAEATEVPAAIKFGEPIEGSGIPAPAGCSPPGSEVTVPSEKPKRHRRTKAEIEAEKNLNAGGDVSSSPDPAGSAAGNSAQSEATEPPRSRPAEISASDSAADSSSPFDERPTVRVRGASVDEAGNVTHIDNSAPVTWLFQLRQKLLASGITEMQFKRYLVVNDHIEPSDRFEKMTDEKLSDIVNSYDSILDDVKASIAS